jgi:hypothetical protein
LPSKSQQWRTRNLIDTVLTVESIRGKMGVGGEEELPSQVRLEEDCGVQGRPLVTLPSDLAWPEIEGGWIPEGGRAGGTHGRHCRAIHVL